MKASEALKVVQQRKALDGVEKWIKDELIDALVRSHNMTATVYEESLRRYFVNYTHTAFVVSMESLGYVLDYTCDDRPCGTCSFKISIPN